MFETIHLYAKLAVSHKRRGTGVGVILYAPSLEGKKDVTVACTSEAYFDRSSVLDTEFAALRALEIARSIGARRVTLLGRFAPNCQGPVMKRIAKRLAESSPGGHALVELAPSFDAVELRRAPDERLRKARVLARRAVTSGRREHRTDLTGEPDLFRDVSFIDDPDYESDDELEQEPRIDDLSSERGDVDMDVEAFAFD